MAGRWEPRSFGEVGRCSEAPRTEVRKRGRNEMRSACGRRLNSGPSAKCGLKNGSAPVGPKGHALRFQVCRGRTTARNLPFQGPHSDAPPASAQPVVPEQEPGSPTPDPSHDCEREVAAEGQEAGVGADERERARPSGHKTGDRASKVGLPGVAAAGAIGGLSQARCCSAVHKQMKDDVPIFCLHGWGIPN
eukprot:364188-Chlamydomonas_euryale.AAC.8